MAWCQLASDATMKLPVMAVGGMVLLKMLSNAWLNWAVCYVLQAASALLTSLAAGHGSSWPGNPASV